LLGWTILLTNVPKERLSVADALVLARCRGPRELVWKLIKQVGKIDTWRSEKPERILTEIFAKILGMLITYWLTLVECWQQPNRSLVKARQVVQWMTPVLALGIAGVVCLQMAVGRTGTTMRGGLSSPAPTQAACHLSTAGSSQAHPWLRLMPIRRRFAPQHPH
jgi:hypothetical protein